VLLSFDLAF